MSSLTSELLTIHEGAYVVRAIVRTGEISLATGLAAASDIEQAEDRAKTRVLLALGIHTPASVPQRGLHSVTPLTVNRSTEPTPSPTTPIPPQFEQADISAPHPTDPTEAPAPTLDILSAYQPPMPPLTFPSADSTDPDWSFEDDQMTPEPFPDPAVTEQFESNRFEINADPISNPPSSESFLPPLEDFQPPESAKPTTKSKAAKRKTLSAESDPPSTIAASTSTEPPASPADSFEIDRSGEIVRIGVEMKRLGWTTEQGRSYLKRTYGKRSRQELDDSELMDFLQYLETLPSSSESPF